MKLSKRKCNLEKKISIAVTFLVYLNVISQFSFAVTNLNKYMHSINFYPKYA